MVKTRWVSCARDINVNVSTKRHLISRGDGVLTTLCGCTASDANVWEDNARKAKCESCVKVADHG